MEPLAQTTAAQNCGANRNSISSAILAIPGLRLCPALSCFILCEQWLSGGALPWVTPIYKKHLDPFSVLMQLRMTLQLIVHTGTCPAPPT